MSRWRPKSHIRVIVIGLCIRKNQLLAAEVLNDAGELKGVRPLGGEVEFGETWQAALKREFLEELDIHITITGEPIFLENIYEHHGHTGHEIVLAAPITFPESNLADQDHIEFREDDGTTCRAAWYSLDHPDGDGPKLFPENLRAHIQQVLLQGRNQLDSTLR